MLVYQRVPEGTPPHPPTGHLDASNGHSRSAADAAVRAAESVELGVGGCRAGLQCKRLDLRAEWEDQG